MLQVLSASLFLLLRPFWYTVSRYSRNRLPPHIEVSSQGYSSKKKLRCTERISSWARHEPPYWRDRTTNHDSGPATLTIARLQTFPLTRRHGRRRHLLRHNRWPAHASADSGDDRAPIVRDLPAVLSVEVPTLACRRLRQKHVTVAVPCLPSPTACPKCCHRRAPRDAPDHRKVARKPFYFDYLVAMLSTWIALHEFPANRELFAAPSVISSRSYRRSLSGRHIFPFSDHHSRHISASEFCRGSPRWIQGF
jgi:hypothetical protein